MTSCASVAIDTLDEQIEREELLAIKNPCPGWVEFSWTEEDDRVISRMLREQLVLNNENRAEFCATP